MALFIDRGINAGTAKAAQALDRKLNQEFESAVLTHPSKRTGVQGAKLASWLTQLPYMEKLGVQHLNSFIHNVSGVELYQGQTIFRAGDTSDHYYIVVQGQVTFYDIKDKDGDDDADPVAGHFGPKQCFGEEEIMSSSRRVFTATVAEDNTIVLRCSAEEYKKGLEDIHMEAFDLKVDFLSSLSPMKPLRPEVVRKLAPCFQLVEFRQKDVVVRQGEKADAMYAVKSGSCAVIIDPHYQEPLGPGEDHKLGELDPKKTLQVVTLDVGAIIGDITVLAAVKRRTASVIATTDLQTYRIRRSVFLRRVPVDQLDVLRRLANEKMKLTDKKVNSRPAAKGLLDQILHGHNLRELFNQQQRAEGKGTEPEEYLQLMNVLRRYKRNTTNSPQVPAIRNTQIPAMLMLSQEPSHTHVGGMFASFSGGSPSPGRYSRAAWGQTGPPAGVEAQTSPRRASSALPVMRGSPSVATAIARAFPAPPGASYALHGDTPTVIIGDGFRKGPQGAGAGGHPHSQGSVSQPQVPTWRPVSPKRQPGLSGHYNYHSRPFVTSVTLKTLSSEEVTSAAQPGGTHVLRSSMSPMRSPSPSGMAMHPPPAYAGLTVTVPNGHQPGLPSALTPAPPSFAHTPSGAPSCTKPLTPSAWSSTGLGLPLINRGMQATPGGLGRFLTHLDLRTDLADMTAEKEKGGGSGGEGEGGGGEGDNTRRTSGQPTLEAALDKLSKPLLDAAVRPGMRRGASHYRPTIPKALL